jgi:TM2 domain-containing membrane protein YozV
LIIPFDGHSIMSMSNNPAIKSVPNSFAAIMTMMLPGLGQMLKGQIMPGIFWSLGVGFGYFSYFWPGIVIHSFCILDAALTKGEEVENNRGPRSKFLIIALALGLIVYIFIRNF